MPKNNKIRVAINGFGRIGRAAFKIALEKKNLEIVAINDLTDLGSLAYLLKYDTVYGTYDKPIKAHYARSKRGGLAGHISVAGKRYPVYAIPELAKHPWGKLKVDVVLEGTGRFTKDGAARDHIKAGARKVIVSAPTKGKGKIKIFVKGVNSQDCKGEDVISNASCTTNSNAPVLSVLHEAFGVEKAMMTTVHGYTATQGLVDGPHKDPRRGRAAAQNIIPTTTGAAIATTETIPDLKGRFDGIAMRVPVLDGSVSDFTMLLKKKATAAQINQALKKAANSPRFKGILTVTEEPIVSSDIIGSSYSAIVDLAFTKVVDGNLAKVLAWYDNEWGYSNRLVEMITEIAG
jgi:glyceraldehyde 3-phosphate dehydrogenase